MIPVPAIIAGIAAAKDLIAFWTREAERKRAAGEITQEELDNVREEAGFSDMSWDERVAAAKARLQEAEGG